jgi:hypothetical protein
LSLLINHARQTFGPTKAPEKKPIPPLEPRQVPVKKPGVRHI